MTILMVEAWGDFDIPYDINIGIGEKSRIEALRDVLNTFCSQLPGCDQDIKLTVYIDEMEYANVLINRLVDANLFTKEQAESFIQKLIRICGSSSAYVYKNMFSCVDIDMI